MEHSPESLCHREGGSLSGYSSGVRVLFANLIRQLEHRPERSRIDVGAHAALRESGDHDFGRDVAHQLVPGERAAAKPSEGAVESPATRLVRCQHLFDSSFWPAMQMDAQLQARHTVFHAVVERFDLLWR